MSQWTGATAGADYDAGRPPWPAGVREFLASLAPPGGWAVAVDLAAGTGKLTERVLEVASTVVAVEPSPVMSALLRRRAGGAQVLEGRAEAIPLAAGSADLVVAGNAFHWFDPEPAAAEIERILRPGGVVAGLWHAPAWPAWYPDLSARLAGHGSAITDAAHRRAGTGEWKRGLEPRFGPLRTTRIATRDDAWSRRQFSRFMASSSAFAALDEHRRAAALAIVDRFLEAVSEPIVVTHRTDATWGRKPTRSSLAGGG